ncbi:hypothetical protein ABVK25_010390 [Lepraria finkii]|uniref:Uncharacterized protein n=1 Tax=Lepraria finkii TaxID=1340010 RepID=A0ABR4AVQ2_9LECA
MDHSDTESALSEAFNIPSQLSSQVISSAAPSVPANRTRNTSAKRCHPPEEIDSSSNTIFSAYPYKNRRTAGRYAAFLTSTPRGNSQRARAWGYLVLVRLTPKPVVIWLLSNAPALEPFKAISDYWL